MTLVELLATPYPRRDFLKQAIATLITPSVETALPTTRDGIIRYVQENIGRTVMPELIEDSIFNVEDDPDF